MKKILLAISVCVYGFCFSRGGTLTVQNNSPYAIMYTLVGGDCHAIDIEGTNAGSLEAGDSTHIY